MMTFPASSAEEIMQNNPKAKILVAEDDDVTQRLVKRFLERSGFLVVTADNGEDALNLAISESPAAVLLDLMMPKMDGFGFLNALRSTAAAGLPVIVTSALADTARQTQAFALGASEYLVKTKFTLVDLVEAIKRHLPPETPLA
jgi:two-component system response regulator ResD